MTAFRIGVIGDPVAHSVSPEMQQAAFDDAGIDAMYERWLTPADQLANRLASLRPLDALGANVTVPHKAAVIPYLDEVSALATRAGAVNTIINRNGKLLGDNTDVHGFATAVLEVCANASSRNALIFGTGGATRGVILALEAMGVSRISVASRSKEKSLQLAAELAPTAIDAIDLDENPLLKRIRRASIIVNATPLGWHPGEMSIPAEYLEASPPNALIIDLTYRDTDLLVEARRIGRSTLDGLPMLVHQGAASFQLWTGKPAPIEVMMAAATRARAARA